MWIDKIKSHFLIIFLFCLAIFVYLPILIHIDWPARGDWDLAFFNNAVPFITIKEYHQLPLWNPFYCGGFSYIASPDSTLFSLQTLFSLMIDNIIVATKINLIFHVLIGLSGMWLLCQYFRFNLFSSLIAAVIFVFNGCITSHIGEGPLDWFSILFLPWVVLFFLKSQQKKQYIVLTGLILAVMFYDRGGYTFNFSVLLIALLAVSNSVLQKKIKPFGCFMLAMIFWAGFSAPKLIPLLNTLIFTPRLSGKGGSDGIITLLNMYIYRNMEPYGFIHKPFIHKFWWEINAYIGIIPLMLFLGGLTIREYLPWSLASVFFFMLSLGNFSTYAPWTLLHSLPIFNAMLIPPRVNLVLIFILAILAGAFLNRIEQEGKAKKGYLFLAVSIAILISADLVNYSHFVINQIPRPFPLEETQYIKSNSFEQIRISGKEQKSSGAWSHMYPNIWKNKGVLNGYFKVPFKRYAKAKTDKGYQGEVYLEKKKGSVDLASWSPNQIVYNYNLTQADRLVINQNFIEGWHANNSMKVEVFKGLISVPLKAEKGSVVLYYFPYSLMIGMGIFILTIISALFLIRFAPK